MPTGQANVSAAPSASQAHSQAQPAANRHPAGIGRHISGQEHQAIEHETRRTIATPGVVLAPCAALPNLAVFDQGGASGAAGPASAPGSGLGGPARRTPGPPGGAQIKLAQSARGTRVSAQPSFLAAPLSSLQRPRPGSPAGVARRPASPSLEPASFRKGLGAYEETERVSDARSRHAHQQRPARPSRCVTHVSPRLEDPPNK